MNIITVLYNELRDRCYSNIRRKVYDYDDSWDILHDAFIALMIKIKRDNLTGKDAEKYLWGCIRSITKRHYMKRSLYIDISSIVKRYENITEEEVFDFLTFDRSALYSGDLGYAKPAQPEQASYFLIKKKEIEKKYRDKIRNTTEYKEKRKLERKKYKSGVQADPIRRAHRNHLNKIYQTKRRYNHAKQALEQELLKEKQDVEKICYLSGRINTLLTHLKNLCV